MSNELTSLLSAPGGGSNYDSGDVPMSELTSRKEKKKDRKKKNKDHHAADVDSSDDDDTAGAGGGDTDPHSAAHAHGQSHGHAHGHGGVPAPEGPSQDLLNLAKSKYDMKNHMANERTFFKYLFTGLHLGSIGTLVLTYFSSDDRAKLFVVGAIWVIAFGFMFWGLYGYYKRKHLMETGQFKDTQDLNPHMPLIVTGLFVFVIMIVIAYSLFSHQWPSKNWKAVLSVTGNRAGAAAGTVAEARQKTAAP